MLETLQTAKPIHVYRLKRSVLASNLGFRKLRPLYKTPLHFKLRVPHLAHYHEAQHSHASNSSTERLQKGTKEITNTEQQQNTRAPRKPDARVGSRFRLFLEAKQHLMERVNY